MKLVHCRCCAWKPVTQTLAGATQIGEVEAVEVEDAVGGDPACLVVLLITPKDNCWRSKGPEQGPSGPSGSWCMLGSLPLYLSPPRDADFFFSSVHAS